MKTKTNKVIKDFLYAIKDDEKQGVGSVEDISALGDRIAKTLKKFDFDINPNVNTNFVIDKARHPLAYERAIEQNDIIDNAFYRLVVALTSLEDVAWNMAWIGEIADLLEDYALEKGFPFCRPWFEGEYSSIVCYKIKNSTCPDKTACGRSYCNCNCLISTN